jgi:cytochrome c biogenesis protein CcdA/thiol-disulfide isomerase/thioredoxin
VQFGQDGSTGIAFALVYVAGVLTIFSPCILPVLPFVFSRAGRPFVSNGLPMLIGMAITFAAVASLAGAGGSWAVQANEAGRLAALILLGVFGLTLLFSGLATRLARPAVALGSRLAGSHDNNSQSISGSVVLGVATGLLWAPCAGPVLGLILTGAALRGASPQTALLLGGYAAGAATSLGVAVLVGGRAVRVMRHGLGATEWLRRGLGVAVVGAVAVIALGLDTSVLAQLSLGGTTSLEQGLLDRFGSNTRATAAAAPAAPSITVAALAAAPTSVAAKATPATVAGTAVPTDVPAAAAAAVPVAPLPHLQLPVEDTLPSLSGAVQWLNSPPLSREGLRGSVVVVDFWTYSCINCLREIPYVQAWADKYRDQGLVVIGVHAPEFAFEKNIANVQKATSDLKITFPVAIDNNYAIWRGFDNEYWPAEYFIDAQGQVRHHAFGETDYDTSERVIQQLLAEAGHADVPGGMASINATGVQAAADMDDVNSPETYIGFQRARNFGSSGGLVRSAAHTYVAPTLAPALNEWRLSGNWTVSPEYATLNEVGGGIVFRFHARDLHVVMGPASGSGPIHFKVALDGAPPGENHGVDIDAAGQGVVTDQRLYQLVRQTGSIADHTFEIQFLDPGLQAYTFTFG